MGVDVVMYARLKKGQRLTQDEITKYAVELAGAFGPNRFWIFAPDFTEHWHHAISELKPYEDGERPFGLEWGEDEQVLDFHLGTRYYGAHYERGDLSLILSVADWIDFKFPGSVVYYGGDSGVTIEPLQGQRSELWAHWCTVGRRPYQLAFDRDNDGPTCEMCHEKTIRSGWGSNYAAWFCYGCGEEWTRRDGVITKGKIKEPT